MSLDKSLTYYLAGKMSGLPQFNLPMFDRVTADLRRQGYKIISPAELDDPKVREACLASPSGIPTVATNGGGTWADFLARDIKIVADQTDGIIILPGWEKSNGARLEIFTALLLRKKFAWWNDLVGIPVEDTRQAVWFELKEFME